MNALSDFEGNSAWSTFSESFDTAINDPTTLLDKYWLPDDQCDDFFEGVILGTASIVSDGSFDPASSIEPVRSSTIILASSTECNKKIRLKHVIGLQV